MLLCSLIDMILGPEVSQNSLILGDYFFFSLIFLHIRCVSSQLKMQYMPGPNPWEIIIGLSNVVPWETKVLDHILDITCAFSGFLWAHIFSHKTFLLTFIWISTTHHLLHFPIFLTSTLISLVSGDYYYKICIGVPDSDKVNV